MIRHDPRTVRAYVPDGSLHCFNTRQHPPARLTEAEYALLVGQTGISSSEMVAREPGRLTRLVLDVVNWVGNLLRRPVCEEVA